MQQSTPENVQSKERFLQSIIAEKFVNAGRKFIRSSIGTQRKLAECYILFTQNVIEILKNPFKITEKEIDILAFSVEDVKFFKDLIEKSGTGVFKKCLKRLEYLNMKAYSTVFRQGQKGNTFYILLKGKVDIFKEVPVPIESQIKPDTHYDMNGEQKVEMIKIKTLEDGSSFGEIALIEKRERMLTIKCQTDCHFATLKKEDFRDILSKYEEKKILEKLMFLKSLSIFQNISMTHLRYLFVFANYQTFKTNEIIFREKDFADKVYILIEGEINISVKNKGYIEDPRCKSLNLSMLGTKSLFGFEEIMEEEERRGYTAKCLTNCAVLFYAVKEFKEKILRNELLKKRFIKQVEIKREYYHNRLIFIKENYGILKSFRETSIFPSRETRKKAEQFDRKQFLLSKLDEQDTKSKLPSKIKYLLSNNSISFGKKVNPSTPMTLNKSLASKLLTSIKAKAEGVYNPISIKSSKLEDSGCLTWRTSSRKDIKSHSDLHHVRSFSDRVPIKSRFNLYDDNVINEVTESNKKTVTQTMSELNFERFSANNRSGNFSEEKDFRSTSSMLPLKYLSKEIRLQKTKRFNSIRKKSMSDRENWSISC